MAAIDLTLDEERSAMTPSYHFVEVMGALFEPKLKLRVTPAIPYDAFSKFELAIEHDPEIDAGRLTMPPPAWLVDGWSDSNPARPPTAVPFRSSQSRTLTTLIGNIEVEDHAIAFVLQHLSAGFAGSARRIEEGLGDGFDGQGFEIIHQLLRAAMDLPFWDDQARLRLAATGSRMPDEAGPARLGLWLERRLAAQLAENSRFEFDQDEKGEVRLAGREARS